MIYHLYVSFETGDPTKKKIPEKKPSGLPGPMFSVDALHQLVLAEKWKTHQPLSDTWHERGRYSDGDQNPNTWQIST